MIEPFNDPPPDCFGKHWDEKVPACSGGLDPTFKDPETGSRVRERCQFYVSCGARTQLTRTQQYPPLLPATRLVRPPSAPSSFLPITPPPPPQATNQALQIQQLMQQVTALQQQNAQLASRQGPYQHPGPYPHPMMTTQPLQMIPAEYKMPGYLTVPEPKSNSIWSMLARSVARSAFKSVGHTVAAFWDSTPIGTGDE